MSLRLSKPNHTRRIKAGLIGGAIVIGATAIVLNTFPHLKKSIYNYVHGINDDDASEEEDRELRDKPVVVESEQRDYSEQGRIVEVFQSEEAFNSELRDISSWSNEKLIDWLAKRDIHSSKETSHNQLVSLVSSIATRKN
ncbi:hypothetical protein PVL30_002195 [Lodderomyces elongisporus]|uniref:uncharacterized protein n=1 Tax=Lodderomyces elongisporus TaxID=36914 RepID=UPI00291EB46C|nr:uncharacterized protein PVL30_002195 [Lodderomyces elongisporus]WLF78457.1 hypothetical protein PVL30_002195 [Lodderomyces elongisporus]